MSKPCSRCKYETEFTHEGSPICLKCAAKEGIVKDIEESSSTPYAEASSQSLDPKAATGALKAPLWLNPPAAEEEMAKALQLGITKGYRHNMNDPLTIRDVLALTARDDQWKRFQRTNVIQPSELDMMCWQAVSAAMAFPFGTVVPPPQPKIELIDTEEQARYRFADAFLEARDGVKPKVDQTELSGTV